MLTLKLRRVLIPILLAVSLLLVPLGATLAQETSGQGLEISPPLLDVQVEPGQTETIDIRLKNITDTTVVAKGQVNDFVAQGETGLPKILLEEEGAEPSPYSIKEWVGDIPSTTLSAGEAKNLEITLNVPENASPGGHYGVIRFTAVPPELEGQDNLALAASIGTLVLANVSGEVSEQLELEEFAATRNGQTGSFFEYGPITFFERFNNSGNTHVKPQGTLSVKNLFGQQIASLAVNETGGNVLPASVRKFEQTLEKELLFGRYTAQLDVSYGDGKSLSGSLAFWVVPYKIIGLVLAGLLMLIVTTRWVLRSYEKRIISKHQSRSDQ